MLESNGVFARIKEAGASPYPVSVVTGLADRILLTYPESAKRARELLRLPEEDGFLSGRLTELLSCAIRGVSAEFGEGVG